MRCGGGIENIFPVINRVFNFYLFKQTSVSGPLQITADSAVSMARTFGLFENTNKVYVNRGNSFISMSNNREKLRFLYTSILQQIV